MASDQEVGGSNPPAPTTSAFGRPQRPDVEFVPTAPAGEVTSESLADYC
ncbi:MAG: hypothetical protein ACHQ6T_03645 [Myxococcota bacterium]